MTNAHLQLDPLQRGVLPSMPGDDMPFLAGRSDLPMTFSAGLAGFPGFHRFVFGAEPASMLYRLAARDPGGPSFRLVPAAGLLPEDELATLDGADQEVFLLTSIAISGETWTLRAHLRSPVILDYAALSGRQVIIVGNAPRQVAIASGRVQDAFAATGKTLDRRS